MTQKPRSPIPTLQFSRVHYNILASESVTLQDSEGNEEVRDDALIDQKNHGLVNVRDRRISNRNPIQKGLYRINMFEQTLHFRWRCVDLDRMLLNFNYYIQ